MASRVFIILLILLPIQNAFSCKLNPSYKYISLSGPITMLLENLGLIEDNSLSAISTLNPVDKKLKVKRISGGIFLSARVLKSFSGKVVFIDKSRELEKNISKHKTEKLFILDTRDVSIFHIVNDNLKTLSPYLINCDEKIGKIRAKLAVATSKLNKLKKSEAYYIFYLGKITKSKKPELIIVNDGAVKTLLKSGIKSYPSELAYVSWSEKIMKNLNGNVFHIGISDSHSAIIEISNVTEKQINFSVRGALIPGISQFRFLETFIDWYDSKK